MRTSEKNRFTNALTVGNCKLDMVFSDIFGKTSSAIINTILLQNEYNDEDILKNIQKNCKASNEDILKSISGISWEAVQKQCMNVIQEHIDYLDKSIKTIRDIIDYIIATYESDINLLCSILGVDRKSAITIISEIGIDMRQFSSHYCLDSWAGLALGYNEFAGKKKTVKISRVGVYTKPALVDVAHCAVKDKSNNYYAKKFNIISKCHGKKRAYIAIARKILVAIYHMLSTDEFFNPSDASKIETSDKNKNKFTKNNFMQSTKQLIFLGLTIDDLQTLIQSKISEYTPVI